MSHDAARPAAATLFIRERAGAWILLGVYALLAAGLLSLLLAFARTPVIQDVLPGRDFFHVALVVHVDLSVLVWFMACAGLVWTLFGSTERSRLGAVAHLVTFPVMHGGTGRQAEVVGVWVADAFRFSGIDALLVDHALARADDLGCEQVHVLANGARSARHSFWERAGFIHLAAGYVRTVIDRPRLRRIS